MSMNDVVTNLEMYGSGGSEINLSMAAYRYFRHKYNNSEGLDGSWLMHEAFSIRKLIDNVDIGNKEKYALFTAFFQSGKTFLAIDLVIIYLSFNMTQKQKKRSCNSVNSVLLNGKIYFTHDFAVIN